MKQSTQTALGLVVYLAASATIAGAWGNLPGFGLWLAVGFGLLAMMPESANRLGHLLPVAVLLAAPWLAGFWR
jgi:hypothetical protein